MERDLTRNIRAEHSEPAEFHPFSVSDLAVAIAQRQLSEEKAVNLILQPHTDADGLTTLLQKFLLAMRSNLVQRTRLDGETVSPEEFSILTSNIDWSNALKDFGFKVSDEEVEHYVDQLSEHLFPVMGEIYNELSDNPDFHLFLDQNLDSAMEFAQDNGTTIVDVFREEDLYLKFAKSQLTPRKIISSVDEMFSESMIINMAKMTFKYSALKEGNIDENFDRAFDLAIEHGLLRDILDLFKESSLSVRNEAIKFYIERYCLNDAPPAVED